MGSELGSWQCLLEWLEGKGGGLKVGLTRPSLAVISEHILVIGSMFTLIGRSGVVH